MSSGTGLGPHGKEAGTTATLSSSLGPNLTAEDAERILAVEREAVILALLGQVILSA
ncbi:MAG: hypothetical protein ACE5KM_11660 [Planctomycetaceae bacterium]